MKPFVPVSVLVTKCRCLSMLTSQIAVWLFLLFIVSILIIGSMRGDCSLLLGFPVYYIEMHAVFHEDSLTASLRSCAAPPHTGPCVFPPFFAGGS